MFNLLHYPLYLPDEQLQFLLFFRLHLLCRTSLFKISQQFLCFSSSD